MYVLVLSGINQGVFETTVASIFMSASAATVCIPHMKLHHFSALHFEIQNFKSGQKMHQNGLN
jgi:hypothetical protein